MEAEKVPMSNQEKILLVEVLSKGYAKPDLSDCCTGERTVFETKDYRRYIDAVIQDLLLTSKIIY